MKGGHITSGRLRCRRDHIFFVKNGVPVFLVKQNFTGGLRRTKKSFSAKWDVLPDYGQDSKTWKFQLEWYLQRYGWNHLENLSRFLSTTDKILEVGIGTGPLLGVYAEHTRGHVFGLDLSSGVFSAYKHYSSFENVHLVQADLRYPPFPKRSFDFIVADQVLHHTPDTEESFSTLVKYLRPGGQIAVYVYRKKGPLREFADDFLRSHTTRLSPEECYRFSRSVTYLGKLLSDLKAEIELPEPIPFLEIPAGRHNVQRLFYWHVLKCFWNDDFDFHTNVMVNFDWYHPPYAHRHTPEEVKRWIRKEKLKLLHLDVSPSGISFRAQK